MSETLESPATRTDDVIDPILATVISHRLNAINREMNDALMHSARSALISVARDMSGALMTADGTLISLANSLPIHILGSHLQVESLRRHHPTLRNGDAYLHNDPYEGCTHPADFTLLVPVVIDDVHCFTLTLLAHQADIGNSQPTTYMFDAKDVYNEGALIFTATQIQRDYEDVEDIIRMCRKRIRAADQWYADYRAMIGAIRLGEQRIREMSERFGAQTILRHLKWMANYGDEMMGAAIRELPAGRAEYEVRHDPAPGLMPDGFRIHAAVEIDPKEGKIIVDLTDNDDCMPNGLNLSEATTLAGALIGVMTSLPKQVPITGGSFRRIEVKMREGAAVGKAAFPHSASLATTNLLYRLIGAVQCAFANIAYGLGSGAGASGMSAAWGVISGHDRRFGDRFYVNQLFSAFGGGPATARVDGWINFGGGGVNGMLLRDSIEVVESKYPVRIESVRIVPGSGGAGKFRGAPGQEITYGPRFSEMELAVAADGMVHPPAGVHGGHAGGAAQMFVVAPDGSEKPLPGLSLLALDAGYRVRSIDNGGGGYGDPLDREPARVLADVVEGYETAERARSIYGVALVGVLEENTLRFLPEETVSLRSSMRG
ncbi:hydantoinase B/oxoprolinase family protein [Arthrobacter sp. S39]|uniref:hydantoinase B/oxoprolinase family protein n=1 Tax=Arthrobacter sp. S39 TaxID=2509720 RepID=UPI0013EF8FD0|nr:hydantoinase B/oxoprolinase family protein [Arthrobacter sp. S39]